MRILFLADLHLQPQNHENTVPALDFVNGIVQQRKPDIVVVGGDLYHNRGRLDPTSIYYVRRFVWRVLRDGASMLVVPGNHDAANSYQEVDSVTATLSELGDPGRLVVAAIPGVVEMSSATGKQIAFACVPCPSKYHIKAKGLPGEDVVEMLGAIYRNLANEAQRWVGRCPIALVMHGGVAGGKMETEHILGVGQDVTIPREFLAGPWELMMAGHLHAAQEVGGVHYPGSLTQLTFAQSGYVPTVLEFNLRDGGADASAESNGGGRPYDVEIHTVPVMHPLVTVDVDAVAALDAGLDESVTSLVSHRIRGALQHNELGIPTLERARVRVRIRAVADQLGSWDEGAIRQEFPEAHDWRFVIERQAPVRIRSEVDTRTPLAELLAEWVRLNPELEPVKDELIELGREINAEVEAKGLVPNLGDYSPVQTYIRDFKQFGEATIDWDQLPRITNINGPNTSGKTNAMRSERFALFGLKALGGSPLRRTVREGARSSEVRHVFTVGAESYKIERTVKLSSSGRASSDVSFARYVDDAGGVASWESLNGADARETQKRIEALVGSFEMFVSTRTCQQHQIARLLHVTPAERKDVLLEAIQAGRFLHIESLAREQLNDCKRRLTVERETLRAQVEGAAELERDRDALASVEGELRAIGDKIGALEAELGNARETAKQYRARAEDEEKALGERARLETRIGQARARRKEIEEGLAEVNAILEKAAEIEDAVDRINEIRGELETLGGAERRHRIICQQQSDLEHRVAAEIRERSIQVDGLRDKIAGAERQEALLGSVPCQSIPPICPDCFGSKELRVAECKEVVDCDCQVVDCDCEDATDVGSLTKGCQFLLDAVQAREDLPGLRAALKKLEDEGDIAARYAADRARLAEMLEENGGDPTPARLALEKELKSLNPAAIHRQAERVAGATARRDTVQQELTRLDQQEADAQKAIEGIELPEERGRFRKIVTTAEEQAAHAEEAIRRRRGQQQSLAQDLGRLKERVAAAEKQAEAAEKTKKVLEGLERRALAADGLVSAMSRDGIPFLILERALPALQDNVNELLEGSPVAVEISPVRDLESGKARDEVNVLFSDVRGQQVLEDASGYQANLLGVALQAGVTELQANAAGVRPSFFEIDEGFGAYDPDNIPHGREMIHKLADRFGRVVYITHVPEVQQAADLEIRVVPLPSGSVLEVAR